MKILEQKLEEQRLQLAHESVVLEKGRQWLMAEDQNLVEWQNRLIATGGIGTLSGFRPESEEWSIWIERFYHYGNDNGIDENRNKSTLLSLVSTSTYALLRDLCSSQTPANASNIQFLEVSKNHF